MAASRPDQAKTGATGAGAIIGAPETQVIPRPGRYLDLTVEVPVRPFNLALMGPFAQHGGFDWERRRRAAGLGRRRNPHRRPPLPLGSKTRIIAAP
jgi:hypothetical protein